MLMLLAQQTTSADTTSSLVSLLPLLLIGAFVYFSMIRPQRRRQQEVRDLQSSMAVGDDVITIGGLHGRIDTLGEDTVDLLLNDDVVVRFRRGSIGEIIQDEADGPVDADRTDANSTTA